VIAMFVVIPTVVMTTALTLVSPAPKHHFLVRPQVRTSTFVAACEKRLRFSANDAPPGSLWTRSHFDFSRVRIAAIQLRDPGAFVVLDIGIKSEGWFCFGSTPNIGGIFETGPVLPSSKGRLFSPARGAIWTSEPIYWSQSCVTRTWLLMGRAPQETREVRVITSRHNLDISPIDGWFGGFFEQPVIPGTVDTGTHIGSMMALGKAGKLVTSTSLYAPVVVNRVPKCPATRT